MKVDQYEFKKVSSLDDVVQHLTDGWSVEVSLGNEVLMRRAKVKTKDISFNMNEIRSELKALREVIGRQDRAPRTLFQSFWDTVKGMDPRDLAPLVDRLQSIGPSAHLQDAQEVAYWLIEAFRIGVKDGRADYYTGDDA